MISGHLHIDALLPVGSGFIFGTPGLSPSHDNNPAFRVYKLRKGRLVDYDQYYADLIDNPHDRLEWKFQYSFRKVYGAEDLSQAEVARVVQRIQEDDQMMWKYRSLMYVGHYQFKAFHKCMLTAVSKQELESCLALKNELGFRG
jgi:hypothetical protein